MERERRRRGPTQQGKGDSKGWNSAREAAYKGREKREPCIGKKGKKNKRYTQKVCVYREKRRGEAKGKKVRKGQKKRKEAMPPRKSDQQRKGDVSIARFALINDSPKETTPAAAASGSSSTATPTSADKSRGPSAKPGASVKAAAGQDRTPVPAAAAERAASAVTAEDEAGEKGKADKEKEKSKDTDAVGVEVSFHLLYKNPCSFFFLFFSLA